MTKKELEEELNLIEFEYNNQIHYDIYESMHQIILEICLNYSEVRETLSNHIQ